MPICDTNCFIIRFQLQNILQKHIIHTMYLCNESIGYIHVLPSIYAISTELMRPLPGAQYPAYGLYPTISMQFSDPFWGNQIAYITSGALTPSRPQLKGQQKPIQCRQAELTYAAPALSPQPKYPGRAWRRRRGRRW